ncbi:MAG: hypothetical protein P4L90_25965 [Rhodopila sp.]|nr:hypothetical protein [Rhodopila sp.]
MARKKAADAVAQDDVSDEAPKSNGPTDREIRAAGRDLADLKRSLREKMEEAASIRGTISQRKKAWKKAGFPVVAIDRVVADMLQDDDELLAEEREYIRIRAVMNVAWSQDDLFPETVLTSAEEAAEDEEQALHMAGQNGYAAGLNGHDIDKSCPYAPGTDRHVKFREQWHHGQAHLAKGLGRQERRGRRAAGGESEAGAVH